MTRVDKEKTAYIYVDQANYHYYLAKHGWKIDWKRFNDYFAGRFALISIYFYVGILSKRSYLDRYPLKNHWDFNDYKKAKKAEFRALREIGFVVRNKPVGGVYDQTAGTRKHKCNFDVELAIDALDKMNEYDIFVLCSGDGDFLALIRYLKGKFKKTVVIPPDDRANDDLIKTANQTIYLGDIRSEIELV